MNIDELVQKLNGDSDDELHFWGNIYDTYKNKFNEKYISDVKKLFNSILEADAMEIALNLTNKGMDRLNCLGGKKYFWDKISWAYDDIDIPKEKTAEFSLQIEKILMAKEILKYKNEYINNTFREYVSKLSAEERYNILSIIKLYAFKYPNQTIFSKDDLEKIIKITEKVDLESSEKRMTRYEKYKKNKNEVEERITHHYLGILLDLYAYRSFRWSIWETFKKLFCDYYGEAGCYTKEQLLEFLLIIDKEELLPFIDDMQIWSAYYFEKTLSLALKKAKELKNRELISKCEYFIDIMLKKNYKDVYDLIDFYRKGQLEDYIKNFSDNPNIIYGLRNQVILYYFRYAEYELFTKEDLEQITEVFKNIESTFKEKRLDPIFLEKHYYEEEEQQQKLPPTKDKYPNATWTLFCDMFKRYDERNIPYMIEFLLIMTEEEIISFLHRYYNGEGITTLENVQKYCLEQEKNRVINDNIYSELASKIKRVFDSYHQKLIYRYKSFFISGDLSRCISATSNLDKDNLKDFLRLSKKRYEFCTAEELQKMIDIIENSKYELSSVRQYEDPDELKKTSRLLGLNNRGNIKFILKTKCTWNKDEKLSALVDFFSILEVYEIADLLDDNIIDENGYFELENILLNKGYDKDIVFKLNEAQKERIINREITNISIMQLEEYLESEIHENLLSCRDDKIIEYICSVQQDMKKDSSSKKMVYIALMYLDYLIHNQNIENISSILEKFDYINIRITNIPFDYFIGRNGINQETRKLSSIEEDRVKILKELFEGNKDKKREK